MAEAATPGFFHFDHPFRKFGRSYQIRFAFKQPGPMKDGWLESLIPAIAREKPNPDAIALLVLKDEVDAINKELGAAAAQAELRRVKGRIGLFTVAYDISNRTLATTVHQGIDPSRDRIISACLGKQRHHWLLSGLSALFRPELVLMRAPSGYAYQTPSGASATTFLNPAYAIDTSPKASFVALAILNALSEQRHSSLGEVDSIYIDSMAIAPVAYGFRQLVSKLNQAQAVQIESFHSYQGIDAVPIPLPGTSLCLISASISLALQKKWREDKNVTADEVITILTAAEVDCSEPALFRVSCGKQDTDAASQPHLRIRIMGETFVPESEVPKRVVISADGISGCDDIRKIILLSEHAVLDVQRRPTTSGSKSRPIFASGDRLVELEPFRRWLDFHVRRLARAQTGAVIFQDDPASKQMAEYVKSYLDSHLTRVPLAVSSTDAQSLKLQPSDSVIVCAAVVGNGRTLLQVSRDLRDVHEGHRTYLIGLQLAEYRGEWKRLAANLCYAESVRHQAHYFAQMATGSQLGDAYFQESKIYGGARTSKRLPPVVVARANLLGSTERVGGMALWPWGKSVSNLHQLRPSFAFWKDQPYKPTPDLTPSVIATVASVLQRAREEPLADEDNQLGTRIFRQVILDPENFARYNDGVLQGALLRSAFPSELDYRTDRAASKHMKEIVLGSFARTKEDDEGAAMEFLVALGLGRLKLVEEDVNEVVTAASQLGEAGSDLANCVEFVLSPLTGRVFDEQSIPI